MFILLREFTDALIVALVIFLLVQIGLQTFKVEGSSMAPTVGHGEYVTVNKLQYIKIDKSKVSRLVPFWEWDDSETKDVYPLKPDGPNRGDIIVFRFPDDPGKNFVKRVIGLPEETISIAHGITFINGQRLNEHYLKIMPRNENLDFRSLGQNEYFVMGDNRRNSNDSRHWGRGFAVPRDNIIGEKWISFKLPFDIGFINKTN